MRRNALWALVMAPVCALPASAHAQAMAGEQSPSQGPFYLLNEPATAVDVMDAFDVGSTFSFRLTAGYNFQSHTALIERENRMSGDASGGLTTYSRVGQYRETTHTLLVNAEAGLYHDLALTFGLPVILSNSREVRTLSDPAPTEGNAALGDGWTQDGRATSLFSVPFRSPERSGIDQIRLGLSWAILNQQRDRTKPSWLVHVEWRPPVGELLHACNADAPPGVAQCPAPSSVPSLPPAGTTNAMGAPTRPASAGSPGVSRGLHGLYFQTVLSRRMGYFEPYTGFDVLAEFPLRDTPFRYSDTPYGQLANFPPIVGSLLVGTEIVPWENRETWQRVMVDVRVRGTYRSPGRDYSPLYDALGSSTSRALAQPGCPSNARMPDGSCPANRNVYFDGLTGVASNVTLATNVTFSVQAAKFLRFNLGVGLSFVTSHLVTNSDACNPDSPPPSDHPEWRGGCAPGSSPDPTHRPAIDAGGGRFRTSDEMNFDIYTSVVLSPRFF